MEKNTGKNSGAEKEIGLMDKIVSLAKRRGFVFPGSEIYGGFANSWDYGPIGVELKNNIKQLWWKKFVHERSDMVGIDAALIMNPKVWEASGHLENFSDPLVECKKCHERFRADNLISNQKNFDAVYEEYSLKIDKLIEDNKKDIKEVRTPAEQAHALFSELDKEKQFEFVNAISPIIEKWGYQLSNIEKNISLSQYLVNELRKSDKFIGFITQEYLNRYEKCPNCKAREWEVPKNFNLMFKTFIGSTEEASNIAYFRPETAQAMFVNFKNVIDTSRKAIPLGIAQIGKAFRNEITPGNFIFRTREFEQMEIEYFIPIPTKDNDWENYFDHWKQEMISWMKDDLGLDMDHIHELEVPDGERAHYSKRTIDFEYDFPFGKKELYGLAYRTDFDLRNHFKEAPYRDNQTGEVSWPHVIEPTWGVDRSILAVLCDSYTKDGDRTFLKLKPRLAPYKAAIFPLLANKPELVEQARQVYDHLKKQFNVAWDDRGNIGKRYYAQDEIGTPFCITVDFDTLGEGEAANKHTVTVRDRDSATQERVHIDKLSEFLHAKIYN